jgi:iron complex outermembrane recepter protein
VAAANLGFNDSFALRLAGTYDERDSFVRNIGPSPSQPGNSALKAIRANLAYRTAEERFTANLRYETFDLDTDNIPIKNRADTVSRDPFVIQEDAISYLRQRGNRTSLELRYGLTPGIDLRVQSAWQRGVTLDQADGDRTATARPQPPAANVGRVAQARTDFKTWLHEINLLSKGEGPVQWVLGAFVLDGSVPVSLLRDNRNTVNFVQSNSTIIAAAYNTSESVFGQVNWFVDPRWEVVAGLRHSSDEQRYNRIALPGPPLPAGTDRVGAPAKSDEVTGKLALNFHRTDDTLAYVSASRGYKAGGVNLTLGTPNFAPEVNNVYEVGYKTTFLDRRLRINGDVFYSDYRDIQYSSLFNNLPLTQNAASGESQGAELEVTGRFGAFGFNVGAGYLDATFAEDAQIVNTITNRQELVPSGAELPFSPGLTLNAGIDYSFALAGDATLTPRLQWSHIGSQLATPFPRVETIVPSRDVVDLRMIYEHADGWLVEAFVNNLFDETYIASQIQNATSATGGIIYGPPQQYGIRVKVGFGP